MAFVDVLMATLKTGHCFESKINMGYGVAMFRLLLLISCLGFVIGCGDESVSEPTAAEPTVMEPTVVEPTVVEPTVVEPTVVEPTVVEPTVVEPRVWVGDARGDNDLDRLVSGLYTEITGDLTIILGQTDTIDLPHLKTVGGDFWISSNFYLTTVDLPQLQSVGGQISGGQIRINNHPTLTSVDLPQLKTVGWHVYVNDNATLTSIEMPQFTIS